MQITIDINHENARLDRFLREHFAAPQSLIAGIIRKNKIKVNGKKADPNFRLAIGDVITVFYQFEKKSIENFDVSDENIQQFQSWIIHESENIIAINKPCRVSSQGGVRARLSVDVMAKGYNPEARIVHRLDRETSGIMIIAKNKHYARHITDLFAQGLVSKQYIAVTQYNANCNANGTITTNIEKDIYGQKMFVTTGDGAVTHYTIIEQDGQKATVHVFPKTGKTHQIRVHLAHIGMPIIGDEKYGGTPSQRMMLHAYSIEFDDFKITAEPTFY